MEKEFVTYVQALALKELGFNEECFDNYYNPNPPIITLSGVLYSKGSVITTVKENLLPAPLYQQAFRFFREKYGLYSQINTDQTMEPKFCYSINKFTDDTWWASIVFNSDLYHRYREAENDLLDKLIEIAKESNL